MEAIREHPALQVELQNTTIWFLTSSGTDWSIGSRRITPSALERDRRDDHGRSSGISQTLCRSPGNGFAPPRWWTSAGTPS